MGWWNLKTEKVEMVARCKARKRLMKHLVKAREAFSGAHSTYLTSLRNTSSALLHFVTAEAKLHHPLPPSPPQIGISSTTTTTIAQPAPPPPPHVSSSVWDFFNPFIPAPGWTEFEVTSEVVATASVAVSQSGVNEFSTNTTTRSDEVAQVVSTKSKELEEIIRELDEYFIKAVDSGGPPALLLEVPTCLNQKTPAKWNAFGKFCDHSNDKLNVCVAGSNHGSTVERLRVLEKRLYLEVKNAETLKLEHENKSDQLTKLELKRVDNIRTDSSRKELEKLKSRMVVASQAIESTSAEIKQLREKDLYPQLVELVKGLICMWRSMHECHQEQTRIVQQFKYLSTNPSNEPTSEIHRQSALQLRLQVQQWCLSFQNLVKAQRDYVQTLSSWLRLSLFQADNNPNKSSIDSMMYSLCEEWQLAINNAPDKLASEGINSLYTVIHNILLQQAVEFKQRKKSEATFNQLERKKTQLQELESKHGPDSITKSSSENRNPVREKRAKVETLRAKAEEEKARYEKSFNVTRSMTVNNLQMGLLNVFQALASFSNIYTYGFESVYKQSKCGGA